LNWGAPCLDPRMKARVAGRTLSLLLVAVGLVGVTWALFVPPWQAPDENSHFAYAQTLAESFRLPGSSGRIFSTEQELALDRSNAEQTAAQPAVKPEWSRTAYKRWREEDDRLGGGARSNGGGPIPSRSNPPLYYAYETPAYLAASGGDIFDRLYLMRLWSVVLLVATTAATWLLTGELLGRNRQLQLVAAGIVGLQPMEAFISASVNPDGMLFALWAMAFWLGVRILKRGLALGGGVALLGVVAAAVLVKGTSYALVPAALLVLAVGLWRLRPRDSVRLATISVAALLAFAAPVGTWLAVAHYTNRPAVNQVGSSASSQRSGDIRGFTSFVWQYYLPRLPFQTRFAAFPGLTAKQFWVDSAWASFGWLEVRFPTWVYRLLFGVSVLTFALAGGVIFFRRTVLDLWSLVFLATAAGALIVGLHWVAYTSLVETGAPFLQGRYLLPLLPLCGVAVALALTLLPERFRAVTAGLVLGAAFALQLFSFGLVAERFYV
jgi:4-amino-4-deoxy-L-arabinose transferase-like glycosyltransferase